MNFTREPIIETVITPKEGYKLILRNSKVGGQEEYAVDAIEVVSFGHSFFFRSSERPKSFLVPVSDYEVIEAKETRVVLKNATFERSIKIGGGRETTIKAVKETPKVVVEEQQQQEPAAVEQRLDKKRERRRHRRRRAGGPEESKKSPEETKQPEEAKGGMPSDETKVLSPILSRLIPPPSQLISDKIFRERKEAAETSKGAILPEPLEENILPSEVEEESLFSEEEGLDRPRKNRKKKPSDIPFKEESNPGIDEWGDVQRITAETFESVTNTSFSALDNRGDFSPFGKIW